MQPRLVEIAPALAKQKKHMNLTIFKQVASAVTFVLAFVARFLMNLTVNNLGIVKYS